MNHELKREAILSISVLVVRINNRRGREYSASFLQ